MMKIKVQVPFEIIKKEFYETLENFELLIRLINESTSFKVYHLEPPIVIPSNEFIIKHSAERFKTYNNPIINSYICRQKIYFTFRNNGKNMRYNNVYYIKILYFQFLVEDVRSTKNIGVKHALTEI